MNNLILKLSFFSRSQVLFYGMLITAFFYNFVYDDGTGLEFKIKQAKNEIKIEREKEIESDIALKEIVLVQNSLESLMQQFQIISAKLPREFQMSEIIKIVDKIAETSELSVRSKEPSAVIKSSLIETLPIVITGDGSFSQIVKFFHFASTIDRIFKIDSFTVNVNADKKSSSSSAAENLVSLKLNLNSYRFLEERVTTQSGVRK